jgi:hypothetical protein
VVEGSFGSGKSLSLSLELLGDSRGEHCLGACKARNITELVMARKSQERADM